MPVRKKERREEVVADGIRPVALHLMLGCRPHRRERDVKVFQAHGENTTDQSNCGKGTKPQAYQDAQGYVEENEEGRDVSINGLLVSRTLRI